MFYDCNYNVVEILLGASGRPQIETKKKVWFTLVVTANNIHSPVESLFFLANILQTTFM